jgi:hypothetical protein
MAGLVPAIYVGPRAIVQASPKPLQQLRLPRSRAALKLDDVDARDKPGHDEPDAYMRLI